MPIVTEGQAQARKRKVWPLGLAVGVLLLFGALPVALAVHPGDIHIGDYRWRAIAGIIEDPNVPPSGYRHQAWNDSGWRYSSWSIRLGRWYYFIRCERGERPTPFDRTR
jgi:hypothetical protein